MYKDLIKMAIEAREKAYTPYSGFKVGSALLTKSGKIFLGCNIENASFSPTICAERTAFAKAVSEGEREFDAIAIVGGKNTLAPICAPCGVCRQVMAEFCNKDFKIILGTEKSFKLFTLEELLPLSFSNTDLN